MRLLCDATLDRQQQQQINAEINKWTGILERILDVIIFLAKQNLAFREHREDLGSDINPGNFLELVQLVGKYDPVMREHLTNIQNSLSTTVSYLSPEIQNKFITVLAYNVRNELINEVKEAKYFSILFDSTPDISHTEQMTEIIRYVHIQDGAVEVKEAFIDFVEINDKKAEGIAAMIVKKIGDDDIQINDCQGQGYDNAATMAGEHNGVQARIRELNPKAEFIACTNHSLNLAGVHAASVCANSVTFFGTIDRVFNFFSSLTHRWDIFNQHVKHTVKRVVKTRWSAKHDAVQAISSEKLAEPNENAITRGDAGIVLTNVLTFPFLLYLNLWSTVLPEVDKIQKYLQTKGLSLDESTTSIQSLYQFLNEGQDKIVSDCISKDSKTCTEFGISTERRIKKKDGRRDS